MEYFLQKHVCSEYTQILHTDFIRQNASKLHPNEEVPELPITDEVLSKENSKVPLKYSKERCQK